MTDALCFDDLDPYGVELDDPLAELLQDLYHRLIEAPGSNLDDPDRGLGLEGMLSSAFDPSWKDRIESELRKDDRVNGVRATITQTDGGIGNRGASYRIDIEIEPQANLSILFSNGATRRAA